MERERKLPDDAACAIEVYPTRHYLTPNDIALIVERDTEHVVQVTARRITVDQDFFFHAQILQKLRLNCR